MHGVLFKKFKEVIFA